MTAFLYFACIMVWGSSWIAIQMQLGDVPILASIFYRFVIAALLLLPCLIIIKKLQKTKPIDHLWFVGQGVCFFSLNFLYKKNPQTFFSMTPSPNMSGYPKYTFRNK